MSRITKCFQFSHFGHREIGKILVSVKFCACNSGAGNGCTNFMGAWNFAFFLQENLHAHKIPRLGGGILGFGEGGSADFVLMGAGIFLRKGKPAASIGSTPPWTLCRPSVRGVFPNRQLQPSRAFLITYLLLTLLSLLGLLLVA